MVSPEAIVHRGRTDLVLSSLKIEMAKQAQHFRVKYLPVISVPQRSWPTWVTLWNEVYCEFSVIRCCSLWFN